MKRTLALLLSFMMVFTACFPAGAITLETIETAETATVSPAENSAEEDAALAAAGTLVPGENYLTGAATYETFEGYDVGVKPAYVRSDTDKANTNYGISRDENLGGKTGANKSFKFVMYDSYPQLFWLPTDSSSKLIETGRKYFISLDIFADTTSGVSNFWLMYPSNNVLSSKFISPFISSLAAGKWYKAADTFTALSNTNWNFQFQAGTAQQKKNYFYVDNFAFVPYYKIDYVGGEADYVLFADESDKDLSKLMTTYTIKEEFYPKWDDHPTAKKCIGMSLTEGGEIVTEVSLANGDVTLYPVWEDFDFSVSCEKPSITGKAGTTTVVTAEDEVIWSFDDGGIGATFVVSADGQSVTVTAPGVPGVAKVKATLKSDETLSVTQKITFIGGDNYRPGINVYTGTTEAFDFEGDVSNVVFHTSGSAVASSYEDDNGKTVNAVVVREKDGNANNHAASVDGNSYYFFIDCDFPVIEKERPVRVSYDYILGLGGAQIRTLINYPTKYKGSNREVASFNIVYLGDQKSEIWRNVTHTRSPGTANSYYKGGENMEFLSFVNYSSKAQATYFDNVSCIPYYKINYNLNGGTGIADPEYFYVASGASYTFAEKGTSIFRNGYAFKGWGTTADATKAVTSITAVPGSDVTLYAIWAEDETVADKYLIELYDGETLRSATIVDEGTAITVPSGEYSETGFLRGWTTADGNFLAGSKFYPEDHMKLYASWGERATLPGINLIENGDFETSGVIDVKVSDGKAEIVDDNGNKVLKYTRNSNSTSIQHIVDWESGRKYRISYKIKTPVAGNSFYNAVWVDAEGNEIHQQHMSSAADGAWKASSTYTYTFPENTESFTFAAQQSDAISFYASGLEAATENVVYYDDLVFIPYYKVTYYLNDGVGELPASEQFLGEAYTVDTDAVITRDGYKFLGWATSPTSVEVVDTVIPTPGKDIDLYATWENLKAADAIKYAFDDDKAGIANGTITVKLDEDTASFTSAELYLADNNGILEDYTTFGVITFADGTGSYTVTGNRAFPVEATRIAVKFIADGVDSLYYWYTIPEAKRMTVKGEKLYSFWATSDMHIGDDYWPTMTVNRNNAFKDIFASDADFVFINGDVVSYGTTPYIKVLDSFLADRLNNSAYNTNNIPVFLTNGNHEYYNTNHTGHGFDYEAINNTYNGQLAYLEETYGDEIKITRGVEGELWYAADYKGAKLIFPSSPQVALDKVTGSYGSFSDEQLDFIDEQLYDGEKNGKVCYIITHYPFPNMFLEGPGKYESGITNSAKVQEILTKHPNTIYFSGHTHSPLHTDETHFTLVGDMTTNATHINDGCLVWLSSWNGQGDSGASYVTKFSTGVYLEVYEDKIIVKSRKFLDDSVYFGHGVYVIELPEVNKEFPEVSMTGELTDGATFTALVDGEVPADDDYTYEWYIGGELVSTEKSFVLDIKGEYAGRTVSLRVSDENGGFASAIFEESFPYAKITYTRNGNSETDTPRGGLWIPGKELQLDISGIAPLKENYFFKGWATEENGTPVASIVVEGDTVLYPVYDTIPEFHFDTSLEGFKPTSNTVYSITDGIINASSVSGDQYFSFGGEKGSYDGEYRNNGTFSADTYKYMRIKSQYVRGSGEAVYFGTDTNSSRSADRRIALSGGTVIGTVDGMDIKEYDLTSVSQWNGTIVAFWYDAIAGNGEVNIDYLVFADNKGIVDADVTVVDGVATLPTDATYTADEVTIEGTVTSVTLIPEKGYEFTGDIYDTATINGYAVSEVVFNDDGSIVLKADTTFVSVDKTRVSGAAGNTFTFTADVASEWTVETGNTEATYTVSKDGKTLTVVSAGYAGPVKVTATQPGNENAKNEFTVTFVGGNVVKPGLNIWTGTTSAYAFDGEEESLEGFLIGREKYSGGLYPAVVATKEKGDNTSNKALRFTRAHQSIAAAAFPIIDKDRKVRVAYDAVYTGQIRVLAHDSYTQGMYNKAGSIFQQADIIVHYMGDSDSRFGNWSSASFDIYGAQEESSGASGYYKAPYSGSDIENLYIYEWSDIFAEATDNGGAPKNNPTWIDNISITPYYKISYWDEAGENVISTEYVLPANGQYTPDVSKAEAGSTGVSLTKGGTRVKGAITLAYEDIDLYSVKNDEVYFTDGTETKSFVVKSGEYFTLPDPEDLDFEINNFRTWNIAGKHYKPGDKVAGEVIAKKTATALCFTKELFDQTYGELVVYYDFVGGITPKYVNPDYVTANDALSKKFTLGAVNVSVRSTTLEDGRVVGEVYATKSDAGFRYTAAQVQSAVPAKYTAYTGIMLPEGVTRSDFTTTDQPWVRLYSSANGSDKRFTETATASINSETFVYSSNTRVENDLNYFGVNFYSANGGTASYYLDGYAVYAYPLKQVLFKTSAEATEYVKDKDGVTIGTKTDPVTTYTTADKATNKSTVVPDSNDNGKFTFKTITSALNSETGKYDVTTVEYTESYNYTFPTVEEAKTELGFNVAHLIAWTDGTNIYKPGETVALKDVQYKFFYPYCQDATKPAISFSFEGDRDVTDYYLNGFVSKELIEDDGRDVYRIAYWNANKTDNRIIINHAEQYDIKEYDILSCMIKIDAAWKKSDQQGVNWTESTESPVVFYAHTGPTGGYTSSTLAGVLRFPVSSNEYFYREADLGNNSNWVNNCPGYGFAINILHGQDHGGRANVDYIRIYRNGISTVNYDTNAPEGATVVTEVAPDTGRGVGTGYLLTGKRPVVEGYKFVGWALTPDATTADVVESIDLASLEATVYAVWVKDEGAIEVSDSIQMKFGDGGKSGIRFKAVATDGHRENVEEYGFIIARKSHLVDNDAELTHNFKSRTADKKLYVQGMAYCNNPGGGHDDYIFDKNTETGDVTYAAVCTGIPVNATGVNETMVARPYYKYTINGKDIYVYGVAAEASLGELASGIDKESDDYKNNAEFIESVLDCYKTAAE